MNTHPIDQLCAAIEAQNRTDIQKLMAKIENYDQIGTKGLSPLCIASQHHDHETMQALLQSGADPDYPGQTTSPLMHVLSLSSLNAGYDVTAKKSLITIRLLIKAGADIDQVSLPDLTTPLMTIVQPEQLEILLKAYPNLDQQDSDQNTALHRLVEKSHMYRHPAVNLEFDQIIEMIEMIIKQGADITIKNAKGKTAKDILMSPPNHVQINPYLKALFDTGNDAKTRQTYQAFRRQVQELRQSKRAKQIKETIGQTQSPNLKRRRAHSKRN